MTREWRDERPSRMALGQWRLVAVAAFFGIPLKVVTGPRRARRFVNARAVAARLMRSAGLSFPEIGQILGGRDHSTAMHLLELSNERGLRLLSELVSERHAFGHVEAA